MIFQLTAGGEPLNFQIVGGTAPPASPRENTIWVDTSSPITGWVFSPVEPEDPGQGLVWFALGAESPVEMNALKKNGIALFPLSARQYLSGIWQPQTPRTYQSGAWRDWMVYLCEQGKTLAGPWKTAAVSEDGSYTGHPQVSETAEGITIRMTSGGNTGGIACFEKKIDLTPFRELVFDGRMYAEWTWAGLCVWTEIGATQGANRAAAFLTGSKTQYPALALDGTVHLDVSQLTGPHYIGFSITGKTGSTDITIRNLYLE